MEIEFNLKAVKFCGRQCMILCQNQNGPCPLLAIANVLILQDVIHFNADRQVINLHALSEIVANAFVEKGLSQGNESESRKDSKQQQLDSALNMIPSMARGLDLNVCFSSVNSFEFTEGISVFDALDIPLLHGWVLDPQDTITYSVVQRNHSYNHLMFKLVEYRSLQERISCPQKIIDSGPKPGRHHKAALGPSQLVGSDGKEISTALIDSPDFISQDSLEIANTVIEGAASSEHSNLNVTSIGVDINETSLKKLPLRAGQTWPAVSHGDLQDDKAQDLSIEDEQLLREGRIIESFLSSTASQLTHIGLMALHQHINEEQFAVFFRNNHFSTMFRHQGHLYLLVTDLGYQHETSVIWERLDGIDGDTEFVDSGFVRHRQFVRSMFYEPSRGFESTSISGFQGTVALPRDPSQANAPATTTSDYGTKSDYATDMNEDLLLAMRLQEAENDHAQNRSLGSSITSLWRPKTASSSSSDARAMQQKAFDQASQAKKSGGKGMRSRNGVNDGEVKSSHPHHDESNCRIS